MKKWLAFLIIIIYLAFCGTARAADELSLQCKSALLLDGASGQVLYEQNADEKCYPASVTKIMTMVLIMEAVNAGTISLDDVVTVSQEAADMGGSQVYLYPGEQRSVDEMMIAIAVGSGNDAAYAMAEFVGGTYGNFIQMMNDKAAELGMSGTHFVNPHGLHDDDHYTTASDLGKLAFYAAGLPGLLDYTSIYEYEFRPEPNLLTLWNTNRLLKWYDGAIGMKTGYTEEAGRNLVAVAERDGLRLISVVLGCGERQGHFRESMDLLNYGFNTFTRQVIYEKGTKVAQIP
ncbi:MAG: D-alanyl-D-alanine carboxypeptidase, partial [Firmicutes bacterium]|nr:D-alanyl-D-alanine carboxypeptidase [Bacillota bacterium]